MLLTEVEIESRSADCFADILSEEELAAARNAGRQAREHRAGRTVWNINSTAVGGGVAEMIKPLLAYARDFGVDARWLVIGGEPDFFKLTKRLHNSLHGVDGGSVIFEEDRQLYERVLRENAQEICARVRPDDVVILHDPQTAGLAPALLESGARVIWRCHIGTDHPNANSDRAWELLAPYLRDLPCRIFSRASYVPAALADLNNVVVQPSIDAFSPKNQEMGPQVVRAILVHVGLIEGPGPEVAPTFVRQDGSVDEVQHKADLIRCGRAPRSDEPLVVQVSRWDRLKDPVGLIRGFATALDRGRIGAAELVVAGPNVSAVADDPEGDIVFRESLAAWRSLPHSARDRVTLASLPTHDVEENAVIVNALQRHASIIVQKSLQEGFGLTVTEGMWKGRPVIASAVGGINDQIEDGVSGVLLQDPRDPIEFSEALEGLLTNPARAKSIGNAARERVREHFLALRHLRQYHELLSTLDGVPAYT
ncbi:MAG: glycosyltransferase [Deltaproteobacteria bacterium]|nr:glycosyltransferase [Deltaproteobacteria bacterium]MBW2496264.1 glycosyltransferase [Deltaproteobacteria bacterium]